MTEPVTPESRDIVTQLQNYNIADAMESRSADSGSRPRRPNLTSEDAPASASTSQAAASSRDPDMTQRSTASEAPGEGSTQKKRRHRGGKKKRNRRQSFLAPSDNAESEIGDERPSLLNVPGRQSATHSASFYRLQDGRKESNTSLDSEALLDHRDQGPIRARRQSVQGVFAARNSMPFAQPASHRPSRASVQPSSPLKSRVSAAQHASIDEHEDEAADDRTPLMASSRRDKPNVPRTGSGYGGLTQPSEGLRNRRSSAVSPVSSRKLRTEGPDYYAGPDEDDYDVNNPPSVPGSPQMGVGSLDDVMINEITAGRSPNRGNDAIIDIDDDASRTRFGSSPPSPVGAAGRRHTVAMLAEDDVCFPGGLSEIGEEDDHHRDDSSKRSPRRRRARQWPDLDVLDEWSRGERRQRDQALTRTKKISEPVMVGGRLRPSKTVWHRQEDDAPYRFTYFNESFTDTIHARNISDLCQEGDTFKDLFIPERPELDENSDDEDEEFSPERHPASVMNDQAKSAIAMSRQTSVSGDRKSDDNTGDNTPQQSTTPRPKQQPKLGPRPTFWLDVLSPTDGEMKVLEKAFGIHRLTTEDIQMQEPREKVELFQSYYFVNYRSFEQDKDSEDYMEPVNMYVVVFQGGVISFHFSMTPHPANVRRRIRQLSDYMSPTADWISYAIIDDITDAFAPLVQRIEDEVDQIDDAILSLHSSSENEDEKPKKPAKAKELESEKQGSGRSDAGEPTSGDSGGDMLRRVGECRKKVMSLYRLLGNKADVIKGFAKRCNEHWEVAPKSEIGLYLGDIQDHIVTMTGNLSHYENLLSRAHSNYLAQINIRMNERAEMTADVLGKLTVLGTIVLPMNIVTGMWGMNVHVPGQDVDSLSWFWSITGGLFLFGLACFFIAKRVYGIV
ncbi:CorA metal ion transporter [Elasticomyces elasticus]|nr:CorA metal ion transporter [Elasticomyces elasticus]